MSDPSVETQLSNLALRLELAEAAVIDNKRIADAAIQAINDERTQALKYGVITLGSIVIGLLGWIGSVASTHLPWVTK